jgi:hypothetical protein
VGGGGWVVGGGGWGWVHNILIPVIYLNDYRWMPPSGSKGGDIKWNSFLNLLEGNECKLPAPMNSRSEHVVLKKENDVPVFATSRDVIRYYKNDLNEPQTEEHEEENRMMNARWNVFRLTHVFEADKKIEVKPCARCFSVMVLTAEKKERQAED